MRAFDPAKQLDLACDDLIAEHTTLTEAHVRSVFAEVVARYDQAPVRNYLPVLVPRQVRQLLRTTSAA